MSTFVAWGDEITGYVLPRLKAAGFTPTLPVYPAGIGFTRKDIRKALFDSSPDAPRTLCFEVLDTREGSPIDWALYMTVQSAQVDWLPYAVRPGEVPTSTQLEANWVLGGFLLVSPPGGTAGPVPMRVYIDGIEQVVPSIYIQIDRFPVEVPPDAPLRFGLGAPGQPMEQP